MPVVLVTSRSFSSGSLDLEATLGARGYTVRRGPADHALDAIRKDLAVAEGWIAGTGSITEEHFAAAPRLKVVARYGVGFEAVDLAAADRHGVVVTNTPGANSNAVAEHALALMLATLRAVPAGDRQVRSRDWSVIRGRELGSLDVGLVGFGRIGRIVARLLNGFGCAVLASDPFMTEAQIRDGGAVPVTPDELAERCDVVSLHAPGGTTVVDAKWLDRARHSLILINTARPELVDEVAVATALRSGTLAGFAADTLRGDTRGQDSPLLDACFKDRVVITPHFGAQTVQAVDGMGSSAVENLLTVLSGENPRDRVPFPVPTQS